MVLRDADGYGLPEGSAVISYGVRSKVRKPLKLTRDMRFFPIAHRCGT